MASSLSSAGDTTTACNEILSELRESETLMTVEKMETFLINPQR